MALKVYNGMDPGLQAEFERHTGKEVQNSQVYLALFAWALANGWRGFAKLWREDALAEHEHARDWLSYLACRDIASKAAAVQSADFEITDGVVDAAIVAANAENETLESMIQVAEMAKAAADEAALQWLTEKISVQEREAKEARDFAIRVGDLDMATLPLMDRDLSAVGA